MKKYWECEGAKLYHGDCREVMPELIENSVDSIVTDPPYHLGQGRVSKGGAPSEKDCAKSPYGRSRSTGFMGKKWDGGDVAFHPSTWEKAFRLIKPGGYLLAFGGTRTYHRLVCAIEDAGFEIRDSIGWVYGCLDEHTELVSEGGIKPYHKANIGELVLCYNLENGEYSYQPILEIVEYDYSDTAYRLVGDFGEQVVSRNHRCIIEREGKAVFEFAEKTARQREARVPILENLSELQQALSHIQSDSGRAKQIMQYELLQCADRGGEQYADSAREAKRGDGSLRCLRNEEMDAASMAEEDEGSSVQSRVQWRSQRRGVEGTRAQGTPVLDGRIESRSEDSNDGAKQSSMEGRLNLSESQGSVCRPANQVHSLPVGVSEHGSEGWLRDGAPSIGRSGNGQATPESGSGASQESSCNGKSSDQPDALCDERGTQGIRAWRGHKTAVVRVVPFQYTGKMWCLRVPTGAFVAVRGDVAFPTGNSGFPKSLDVSKAMDRAAGAERTEVIGKSNRCIGPSQAGDNGIGTFKETNWQESNLVTAPATEDAIKWDGWGTALKPAMELIVVARKPLSESTIAGNVLKWGTGAINIDGCRIEGESVPINRLESWSGFGQEKRPDYEQEVNNSGRWPANLIHDGSDEVLAAFPESTSGVAVQRNGGGQKIGGNGIYSGSAGLTRDDVSFGDSGSAARFFYCAKASKEDRDEGLGESFPLRPCGIMEDDNYDNYDIKTGSGKSRDTQRKNIHPTVKPLALMRYLCRLVTPPDGTVLDPFNGSGSTGKAALYEGFKYIGIEGEEEYCAISKARIQFVLDNDSPLLRSVSKKETICQG